MLKITTIVLALCIVFLGCATTQGAPVARIPFPIEEYQKLPQTGTGIIRGQGPLKTDLTGSNTNLMITVSLYPVTSYSNQWYDVCILQGKQIEPADQRNFDYRWHRTRVPDNKGHFEFKELPAGEYYIEVSYAYLDLNKPEFKKLDSIVKKISLKEGETQEIILKK